MISDHLKNRQSKFLQLEQKCGLVLVVTALIIISCIVIAKTQLPNSLWIGLLIPAMVLCIVEFAKGTQLILINRKRLHLWEKISPDQEVLFLDEEQKRLTKTDKKFKKSEYVFMLLIFSGFVFIMLGIMLKWGDFAIGNGVGLLLPSGIIYIVDLYRSFNVGTHLSHIKKGLQ